MSPDTTSEFLGQSLYVHIGAGKTGSTSIQMALRNAKDLLLESFVGYVGLNFEYVADPIFKWQAPIGWQTLEKIENTQAINQLINAAKSALANAKKLSVNKLVWSNESLFENAEIVVPVLEHLESIGVKITVVAYIRNHSSWAQSAYVQWGIKHKTYKGPIQSFPEWVSRNLINYSKCIKAYTSSRFSLVLRNFDCTDDVLIDFLKVIEVDESCVKSAWVNESPAPTALKLWALYNNQHKDEVLPGDLEWLFQASGVFYDKTPHLFYEDLIPRASDMLLVKEKA